MSRHLGHCLKRVESAPGTITSYCSNEEAYCSPDRVEGDALISLRPMLLMVEIITHLMGTFGYCCYGS